MKKIFTLTLVFIGIISLESKAQITLDSLDLPMIGDSLARGITTDIDSAYDPAIKALGATWDCSWLDVNEKDLTTAKFISTDGHPWKDSFPDANIILIDAYEVFCKVDKSGYTGIGVFATVAGGKFGPQPVFSKAPWDFGDSYVSNGYAEAPLYNNGNFVLEIQLRIDREISAVNYGKVKMPDTNFYDVIANRVIEVTEFTTIQADTTTERDSAVYYEFYCKEYSLPLVRTKMNDTGITNIEFIYLGHPITVNKEIVPENHVGIYPNPAKSTIHVDHTAFGSVQIMDMNGKMVHQEKLINGQSINVEKLQQGMYMLHIMNPSGKVIAKEKLVIE